jgi:lipoprotein-releasing system ATP-binding protein
MAEAPLIEARNVTRELPGPVPVTLVRDIDLVIPRGQFVAITGPSGSGKSSLLYLLGLLDVPTQGEILLEGTNTTALDRGQQAHTRLGFVFQFHFLLHEFSVLGNVMISMRQLGRMPNGEIERPPAICSRRPAWRSMPTACRSSSPAASASAWRWPARSPTSRP